jgi:hypothetical protein
MTVLMKENQRKEKFFMITAFATNAGAVHLV